MRAADDSQVLQSTQGLVGYLRELVRSNRRAPRDWREWRKCLWFADMPPGTVPIRHDPNGVVLAVEHVPYEAPPAMPDSLRGWLDPETVFDADGESPPLAPEGPVIVPDPNSPGRSVTVTVGRDENAEVREAYERWSVQWRAWRDSERDRQPRREFHRTLTALARQLVLEDDTLEAVLAVGLLRLPEREGQPTRRHLMACRVTITTERRTGRVTVRRELEALTRLEDRDFLSAADRYVNERADPLHESLLSAPIDPLSADAVEILRHWREHALDRPISLAETDAVPDEDSATLTTSPALIVRKRNDDAWIRWYDRIVDALGSAEATAPLGLAQLVARLEREERIAWSTSSGHDPAILGTDPLFPLETNEPQRQILHRLATDTAVVVEGPPGTGKTHTIANLVCALLAQGKRVLVTSQKEKALHVLREKLPQQIQGLCVLSTGDRGGAEELERSIDQLSEQTATVTSETRRQRIDRYTAARRSLADRLTALNHELTIVREAELIEYEEVDIAPGYQGRLSNIVRAIQNSADDLDWLPPLPESAPAHPPLTPHQILELRALLASATDERRALVGAWVPDPAELPTTERFRELVAAVGADAGDTADGTLAERLARIDESARLTLSRALDLTETALHAAGVRVDHAPDGWAGRLFLDILAGHRLGLWNELTDSAGGVATTRQALQGKEIHRVGELRVSTGWVPAIDAVQSLHDYLSRGGKARRLLPAAAQRAARPVLDGCTVDDQRPTTVEQLALLLEVLRGERVAAELALRWSHVDVPAATGPLPVRMEEYAQRARIVSCLLSAVRPRWDVQQILLAHGIRHDIVTLDGWRDLVAAMAAVDASVRRQNAAAKLDRLVHLLTHDGAADATIRLARATRDRDLDGYAAALAAVAAAYRDQVDQRRCDELANRLDEAHPTLVRLLADSATDECWDTRLARLGDAWYRAAAQRFCERSRRPGRDGELQEQIADTERQLLHATQELAAEHAWLGCISRMTSEQKTALNAFRAHATNAGMRASRYRGLYQQAMRDAMRLCRDAVPAWIMPIRQVIDSIAAEPDSFDVLIVDEASQAGLEALSLLWLAPRAIVVGDAKQCAPSGTRMVEHQELFDRLDTFLPDLPDAFRRTFAPRASLYDVLSVHFPDPVRLVEHFRCVPEIIGWSSEQFYDKRLVPLRQYGAERLPPLQLRLVTEAHVEGAGERRRNEAEAEAIVKQLHALVNDPRYAKKSFGVIVLYGSTHGTGQVGLLERMISEQIDPMVRVQHDIAVGYPPDFQGDQRDVILLATVLTEPSPSVGGSLGQRRRYNVAASRARDQMWLFTSIPPELYRPDDLRRSLLNYFREPPSVLAEPPDPATVRSDIRQEPFDSLFEQRVYLALTARGYHVVPQVSVGGRSLDLVVVGQQSRLAVECDGPHHLAPGQVSDDLARERELRRTGWRIFHLPLSEFELNQDRALRPLWTQLDALGIQPGARDSASITKPSSWKPLLLPDVPEDGDIGDGRDDEGGVP